MEEALAADFWIDLVANVGKPHGLSLEEGGAAGQLSEGVGAGARPVRELVVRSYHDADCPAGTLVLAIARGLALSFQLYKQDETNRLH
jgi:hypothetical protein